MEWRSAAVVLAASPLGESDAVVTALTEAQGLARGLVRGGGSRRMRPVWEIGGRVALRWRGRLAEQLGTFAGEATGQALPGLVDRPMALAALRSCCAVASASLAPGIAVPGTFAALCALVDRLAGDEAYLPCAVRWEIGLLAELGYGLELSGVRAGGGEALLVSPRTGRAVGAGVAGAWAPRMLALPAFVLDPALDGSATPGAVSEGFALTGHFLRRDVFAPLAVREPRERTRLLAMIGRLCDRAAAEAREAD